MCNINIHDLGDSPSIPSPTYQCTNARLAYMRSNLWSMRLRASAMAVVLATMNVGDIKIERSNQRPRHQTIDRTLEHGSRLCDQLRRRHGQNECMASQLETRGARQRTRRCDRREARHAASRKTPREKWAHKGCNFGAYKKLLWVFVTLLNPC